MVDRRSKKHKELLKRMNVLHQKHHLWLLQSSMNITKNKEFAEDLVGDLYLYLMEKGSPSIFYKDSFNLLYCHRFLSSRWLNHVNRTKRISLESNMGKWDREDEIYPIEEDNRIMEEFEKVELELKRLSTTRLWPQAQLFSMYYMTDDNMIEISNKIGICKSTTFNSIKKIRDYLKETLQNPFNE